LPPTTDVSAFVGEYPFRCVPHGSVDWLLAQMERVRIDRAWVGHLPSFLYRDPAPANELLADLLRDFSDRLLPVPTVHPGLPKWEDDINRAVEIGAPAVRVYPNYQGVDPAGGEMRVLAAVAGAASSFSTMASVLAWALLLVPPFRRLLAKIGYDLLSGFLLDLLLRRTGWQIIPRLDLALGCDRDPGGVTEGGLPSRRSSTARRVPA